MSHLSIQGLWWLQPRTLLASLLFSLLPSSLLKDLPLRDPGRSDQSPIVPLLVLFVPFSPPPPTRTNLRW